MSSIVDIVVVHFNAEGALRDCLEPLLPALSAPASTLSLTVVDNDQDNPAIATAERLESAVRASYLPQRANLGFGAACNVGASHGSSPYILLLNPDCVIEPDAIETLASSLARDPSVVATGPRIRRPNGLPEISWARHPGFLWEVRRRRLWRSFEALKPWAIEEARRLTSAPRTVDWLTGACLLVRRDAFESVGGFDERYFLYFEDSDLCLRLAPFGKLRFNPAASAIHQGGASSEREDSSAGKNAVLTHYRASQHLYYQQHRPLWERVALGLWRRMAP